MHFTSYIMLLWGLGWPYNLQLPCPYRMKDAIWGMLQRWRCDVEKLPEKTPIFA